MEKMKKPNIVMFVPDSYRGDVLGHFGDPAAVTPALDALLADGAVSYRNAFSQNPVCTPSRCSFMTGWYPHVHGHRSMTNMLKVHEPNLLKVLRKEGYFVWWGGKNDLVQVKSKDDYLKHCDVKYNPDQAKAHIPGYQALAPLPEDDPRHGAYYHGVRRKDPSAPGHGDTDMGWVRGAVDFIRNRPTKQPFMVYLPLGNPHPAYRVEQEYYDRINPDKLRPRIRVPDAGGNLPKVLDSLRSVYGAEHITEAMWREVKRVYYAMCTKVDGWFGMVVDALKEAGLYDDTLILFFSDHGDFTGDYSLPEKTHSTMQDCLVRVPLMIKPHRGVAVKPGIRDHMTELLDVTATIYDLLGINPGYDHQGKSLRESLAGSETEIHEAVFAEVGGRKDETAFFNKEVDNLPPQSFYGMQSRGARPYAREGSHAVMCRTHDYKYIRRVYNGHHELYDLHADPGETRNLAGDPAMATVESRLQMLMLDYFLRTSDVMPHARDSRQI
ncbi:MAG: hypothetical protein A2340_12320 [Lentisphaerae bacterium RIFOXYB12_FULL_60_10]|nr:MAG: hypothetical protein A2340_12320 [Lentisphaerae bacterium RIFOXYB12_FULL_60_10]